MYFYTQFLIFPSEIWNQNIWPPFSQKHHPQIFIFFYFLKGFHGTFPWVKAFARLFFYQQISGLLRLSLLFLSKIVLPTYRMIDKNDFKKSYLWNKTKHHLQTLGMSSNNNKPLSKKFDVNKSWPPYFFEAQNLMSYFLTWKGHSSIKIKITFFKDCNVEKDSVEITLISSKIKKLRLFKVLMLASRL